MTAPFDPPPAPPAAPPGPAGPGLEATDKRLLNAYQRGFPLAPRPYAEVGRRLGLSEEEVLARLARLKAQGVLDRVGPVFAPHRAGWSTLAAMAVPPERLEAVAARVSARPEVNHNYEREHRFNLWFVVTGPDRAAVARSLAEIAAETGLPVLDLPMEEAYHLDLGFALP